MRVSLPFLHVLEIGEDDAAVRGSAAKAEARHGKDSVRVLVVGDDLGRSITHVCGVFERRAGGRLYYGDEVAEILMWHKTAWHLTVGPGGRAQAEQKDHQHHV